MSASASASASSNIIHHFDDAAPINMKQCIIDFDVVTEKLFYTKPTAASTPENENENEFRLSRCSDIHLQSH